MLKHNYHAERQASYLDMRAATSADPEAADYVLPGLEASTVGALIGTGGTGKSFLALQTGIAVAAGADGDTLDLNIQHGGRVVYVAAEDPSRALHSRIRDITRNIGEAVQDAITEQFHVLLAADAGLDLGGEDISWLATEAEGARLVILDTLACLHRADENSNGAMLAVLANLRWLAARTGAAVLFLHHTSKTATREGDAGMLAARGASALVDGSRYCATLRTMSADEAKRFGISADESGDYVHFAVPKQSYSRAPAPRWLQRGPEGVLEPVELEPTTPARRRPGSTKHKNQPLAFTRAGAGGAVQEDDDDNW